MVHLLQEENLSVLLLDYCISTLSQQHGGDTGILWDEKTTLRSVGASSGPTVLWPVGDSALVLSPLRSGICFILGTFTTGGLPGAPAEPSDHNPANFQPPCLNSWGSEGICSSSYKTTQPPPTWILKERPNRSNSGCLPPVTVATLLRLLLFRMQPLCGWRRHQMKEASPLGGSKTHKSIPSIPLRGLKLEETAASDGAATINSHRDLPGSNTHTRTHLTSLLLQHLVKCQVDFWSSKQFQN